MPPISGEATCPCTAAFFNLSCDFFMVFGLLLVKIIDRLPAVLGKRSRVIVFSFCPQRAWLQTMYKSASLLHGGIFSLPINWTSPARIDKFCYSIVRLRPHLFQFHLFIDFTP